MELCAHPVPSANGALQEAAEALKGAAELQALQAQFRQLQQSLEMAEEEAEEAREAGDQAAAVLREVGRLRTENMRLAGHHNLSQRIRHVNMLKSENDTLQKECKSLRQTIRALKKKHRQEGDSVMATPSGKVYGIASSAHKAPSSSRRSIVSSARRSAAAPQRLSRTRGAGLPKGKPQMRVSTLRQQQEQPKENTPTGSATGVKMTAGRGMQGASRKRLPFARAAVNRAM